MKAKHLSRRELARQRAQAIFVGRQEHLKEFRHNLSLSLDDHSRTFIWMVCGEGGVGKTTLLRQFRSIAEKEFGHVTTYADEYTAFDIVEMMANLADQLAREFDKPLKPFSDKLKKYKQLKQGIEADPERPNGIVADLGRAAGRLGKVVMSTTIPLSGVLHDVLLGEDFIENRSSEFAEYLARKLGDKDYVELVLDPINALTPSFVESISILAAKRPVALCFDTYEKVSSTFDNWLRDILEGDKYGDLDPRVLILIAGRYPLNQEWADEYIEPFLKNVNLNPFSDSEVRAYLQKKRNLVVDEQAANFVFEQSFGLPVLVAMLTVVLPEDTSQIENITQFADLTDQAIDRFLKGVPEEQRSLLLLCALPQTLNLDIVKVLVEGDAAAAFDLIRNQSFVRRTSLGWVYHDLVRQFMLREVQLRSPQQWRDAHTSLFTFFAKERERLKLEYREGIDNQRWQLFDLGWVYHKTCVQGQNAASIIGERLLQAFKISVHSYGILMGEQVEQAGLLLDRVDVIDWGKLIVQGSAVLSTDTLASEHLEHAISLLDNLVALNPESATAYAQRGIAYRRIGKYDNAFKDLDHAIDLEPDFAPVIASRGIAYRELGRLHEALKDLNKAVELGVSSAWIVASRAMTLRELGQYQEALVDINHAVDISPNNSWVIAQRGITYRELGQHLKGLGDLNRAVKLSPESSWVITQRGITYRELGQHLKGLEDLNRAVKLSPESSWVITQRGITYRELGQYQEALEDLNLAIKTSPDNAWTIAQRGLTYYSSGMRSEALAELDRAISLSPGNSWFVDLKQRLLK